MGAGPLRTAGAGTLRPEHAGSQVRLAGWVKARRDHGGVMFLDLRDASGIVQVVVDPAAAPEAAAVAREVRDEYCIARTANSTGFSVRWTILLGLIFLTLHTSTALFGPR